MIRISILEDNFLLLEAVSRSLRAEDDFTVMLEATTIEEASEFKEWDTVDVALVDLQLPDGSSLDLIAELSEKYPDLQLLVCSMLEDRETVFTAMKAGAAGYLVKRQLESEQGICSAIRHLVKGGSPISPAAARWILEDFQSRNVVPEHEALSGREIEILHLLEAAQLYKEIAAKLHLSEHTVHAHVRKIHAKLRAKGRREALSRARKLGYLKS